MSEAPIPAALTKAGALYAYGALVDGAGRVETPWPMLVDTGTVLTTKAVPAADAGGGGALSRRVLELFGVDPSGGAGAARAEWFDTPLLESALAAAGTGPMEFDLSSGGILGGDLLQKFSLALDYSGAAPSLSLLPPALDCSCAIADACRATLPFTLGGGGTIILGPDVVNYPPTRVTLDACLQPIADPLARGEPCVAGGRLNPTYAVDGRPGVDVRLLVATGFHGVLLGASAWDRLHGAGAAAALLASPTEKLYFPGHAAPIDAARATLGDAKANLAALALVDKLGLLGPCGELSRSRRLRSWQQTRPDNFGPSCGANDCPSEGQLTCLQCLTQLTNCIDAHGVDRCSDRGQPAASFVELDEPLDVFVVADTAPILQEVNFDVAPKLSAVEGVVGTALLARLQARIDYPNGRVIASCAASAAGCVTYPRFSCPTGADAGDCGIRGQDANRLCNPPSSLPPTATDGGTPVCLPAPQ